MDIAKTLIRHGLASREQIDSALPKTGGRRLDRVLVELGIVSEDDVLKAFADELGMPFVDVKRELIDRELLMQFPTTAVFRHSLLPISRKNGSVVVATSDPFNLEALEELESVSGFHLVPVLARRLDVVDLIKEHLGVGGDTLNELVAQRSADGVELLSDISQDDGDLAQQAENA